MRDDSDVFQAQTQPPPSKGKRQVRNLKEGSPGKVGGRSGEGEERRRELRWVQVGFEGRMKGLIRIKGVHGRRKLVPDIRSSIGEGATTICRINPGNNELVLRG